MKKLAIVAMVATLCVSCMTVGNKFDPNSVSLLKPGESTIDDATELMGLPMAQSVMPDGNMLYQWQYVQGTPVGGSGAHIAILFTADGKMVQVKHISTQGN
jgi:hypothetical protein